MATRVWNGADKLKALLVPLGDLKPHPDNPRLGNIERIQESLTSFGQMKPIVVQDSTRYIVAGNHTFKAAEAMGWSHVAAALVPLSDEDALRYMIADNRTADLGTYSDSVLSSALDRLSNDGLLDGTGWSADEVDDYLAAAAALPITPLEDFGGGYAESDEDVAEREGRRPTGVVPLRDVVLLYTPDEHYRFMGAARHLEKTWGLNGTTETAFQAMIRMAENEGWVAPADEQEAA